MVTTAVVLGAALVALVIPRARARLRLSRAKHPSPSGHARIAKRLATLVPFYTFDAGRFFQSDGAPPHVAERRRAGFMRLAELLRERAPETIRVTEAIEPGISDLQFTGLYRVPFQYSHFVRQHLKVGALAQESNGVLVKDLDGNLAYDVAGSYGVNVFGYDFYKECIDNGIDRVRALGPLLGTYHPVIEENSRRLRAISGLDEVSFHMSGTEAVMQAVRLARYHTQRSHLVQFCGAYHGWWDGVQPGVGNPRAVHDVYVLKEMDEATLRVLESRRDIACVLVNPLQALHPNRSAPGDGALIGSAASPTVDRTTYSVWLRQLREICTARGIVLIVDEVFLGFRLAYGGAQEYFGVRADMVTYGKTVGGGLPIGVLCGQRRLMKRFRDDRPADVCFARGTFNAHPYVMGAMNEFLRRVDTPAVRESYARADEVWNSRAAALNQALASRQLPVQVANLCSVWTVHYTVPSRYNWMFQYYLRAHGLALSWVGSGRLIFSHNYSDTDFAAVAERFLAAASAMQQDGWWHTDGLTDAALKRRVLWEMLATRVPWLDPLTPSDAERLDRPARPVARAAEPCDTAPGRETGL
ncbi:MAG: aminotransferase class III-fold pyridoxal phosphate-dependent enzyme [Luteitalea sp.]|nr:aminotransferase class III-fold pyridoxal phosphate-dependent enzyme [Luteitalea sp.]